MANGEIIIRIIHDNGGGGGNTPAPDNTESVTTEVSSGKSTNNLATAAYVSLAQKAGRELKGVLINNTVKHVNWYYKMHDNYIAQEQLNIATGIIGKAASAGATIMGFATVGAAAGPVGAVVGAAIGTAVAGINIGLDIYGNYIRERLQLTQLDNQLAYNRERAGYSLTAGSIGENR